ncbi:hypothetical protein [Streptomyces lydicus]|uniref:hypothetical protein n=1 Tax=Streptomyces lydicus TaxID=47763 RepID=UPI00378CF250
MVLTEVAEVSREGHAALFAVGVFSAQAEVSRWAPEPSRYDLTLLNREVQRYGMTPLDQRRGALQVGEPFVIDKRVDRYRFGKRNLCHHYAVPLHGAHTADADALAACRVAWRQGRLPAAGQHESRESHQAQIDWAAEQAASMQTHLRETSLTRSSRAPGQPSRGRTPARAMDRPAWRQPSTSNTRSHLQSHSVATE